MLKNPTSNLQDPLNVQVTPGARSLIEFLDFINSVPKYILLAFRKSGPKCAPKENVLGFCFEEAVCDEKRAGMAFLVDVGERAWELFGRPCYYRMKPGMRDTFTNTNMSRMHPLRILLENEFSHQTELLTLFGMVFLDAFVEHLQDALRRGAGAAYLIVAP